MGGAFDSEMAAAGVRRLAAVRDVDLVDQVRAAAAAVVELAGAWRRTGRPLGDADGDVLGLVDDVAGVLAGLPDDVDLDVVVAAVTPLLGRWWPRHCASANALADAIEDLRRAALHRPSLARHARRLVAAGLV
ncbi:hypothetical protein [Polymorphospora sp. NPDC050346]|uniref:hypothetical protein n=1 Tax=Polymorphospora sp. NPDC050346 TaxID=3155780 RepID=UPI0033C9202E